MRLSLPLPQGLALGLMLAFGGAAPALAKAPDYAVEGKIVGPDGGWDYVTFDPAHRRLYLSRGDGVTAIDVDGGKVTGHLADAKRAHSPVVLPGGDRLVVTSGGDATAKVIDAHTGVLIKSIPVAPLPDAGIYDPASGLVIAFGAKGDATLIDPIKQAVIGSIAVGGKLEFGVADGAGGVFVNVETAGEIARLDLKSKTVAARYPLKGCEEPGGLAYVPSARMLISACGNGVAKIVSAKTGAVLATLAIGKGPDAVIYDPRRRLAFIPCGEDGVLEVVAVGEGADARVIQTVKTAPGARLGMVDPKTGKIYLPTAEFGPPKTPGGWPSAVPGTFHVLVVGPK